MNYTDFLKMIPEAVLVAILIITFIADFATAKKTEVRKWMNPLVSIMFSQSFACFHCLQSTPLAICISLQVQ